MSQMRVAFKLGPVVFYWSNRSHRRVYHGALGEVRCIRCRAPHMYRGGRTVAQVYGPDGRPYPVCMDRSECDARRTPDLAARIDQEWRDKAAKAEERGRREAAEGEEAAERRWATSPAIIEAYETMRDRAAEFGDWLQVRSLDAQIRDLRAELCAEEGGEPRS